MVLSNEIFKADSTEILKDKKLFPNKSVNLIMTSPPYADQRADSYGGESAEKYVDWFLQISSQLFRVLRDDGSFVLNIKEHPKNGERQTYVIELILALRNQGWLWVEEYCWYKKNSFPGKWPNRFRDSWERCLHFTKNSQFAMYQEEVMVPIGDWAERRFKSMSDADFIRHASRNNNHLGRRVANWLDRKTVFPHNVLVFENEHLLSPTNVIELATECGNRNHSAAFPLELPSWFIRLFSKEGDIILDPFLGSGTTAIAAILLNRKYLGIEKMESYYQDALQHIEDIKKIIQKNDT